ncbi:MAG: hypothetical protein ABIH41_05805 [Nanoarchaeota archaeon]
MGHIRRSGQSWSLDLIIAVVIFILIVTIFYTLLISEPRSEVDTLKSGGRHVLDKLDVETNTGPCAFVKDGVIDRAKAKSCYETQEPDGWAQANNVDSKYCIFILDQNNHIISIENRTGFGNSELNVSDTPCGTNFAG